MAALDTDVLVRWVTGDDAAQCAIIERLFRSASARGERLSVPVTVLLEMEWVLRSRYRFDRTSITAVLDALLSAFELEIMEEAAVEHATWLFKQDGAPDFADCLHVGLAAKAGSDPLLTFDARASRLEGARLLA